MTNAKAFKKSYMSFMRAAERRVDEVRRETDKALEALAVEHFGPVEGHEDDGFGPPREDCTVECWHCGEKYQAIQMKRAYRPRMQGAISEAVGDGIGGLTPLWWCRNDDCDGAGFGHDIHPSKAKSAKAKRAKEAAE